MSVYHDSAESIFSPVLLRQTYDRCVDSRLAAQASTRARHEQLPLAI